ncbi:MAG: hypothetical protein GX362_06450 [Methanosarcinaceae archaeon]|nr:hypothetical protein [Methanosarcinaceae archaeon]
MVYRVNNKSFRWWWLILLKGILYLTVGIIFIIEPNISYFLTSYLMILILSGALIFAGISGCAFFVTLRKFSKHFIWGFFLSLIIALLGVALLIYSGDFQQKAIPIIIGVWLLFEGISLIGTSIELKSFDVKYWFVPFIFSIVILFCAILVLFRLEIGAYIFIYWIAFSLILKGLSDILISATYRKMRKAVKSKSDIIDAEFVELNSISEIND